MLQIEWNRLINGRDCYWKQVKQIILSPCHFPLEDLPFGLDERMITRIDNRSNSPQTPSIPSKSSPTNINGHGVVNGNTTTATSKLCHINNHHERALSTTVDSSAQGVELGQGPPEVYGSPLQPVPWGATDGIALMNHHSALTSSR